MSATAHHSILPFGVVAARPWDSRLDPLPVWELLGLPEVRAPRELLQATVHAIRGLTSDTEPSGATATDGAESAAADSHAAPDGGTDGTDDADAKTADAVVRTGPFKPGVVTMEELVVEHGDAVYRVALSVTRDPVLAEDVSQDALIKAWQALPSFRGDSPLRNWVLRITHNTAISTLRKRRDELREPDQLPERLATGSVESAVQDRLALGRFEEALADLDEVSRSIVVLREVEGLSYSELCDVLDLPMPTVKTRLLRARRQLAQALEGWQP